MFDPRDRRRPTTVERSVRTFYRLAWTGAGLVALSVLASVATGTLASLVDQPWDRGSTVGNAVNVSLGGLLFLLAYLLPILLMTVGVALPVVALVRFRDFVNSQRFRGRLGDESSVPLRAAWLLVLAEVPALVLFAALAMSLLVPADTSSKGLKEREVIMNTPVQEMP